jgi:hypothetical protein
MRICNQSLRITGKILRVARPDADKFIFLDCDPQEIAAGLRKCGKRVDLFTFMDRLSGPAERLDLPMELDNLAAIRITTFDNWWLNQLGFKARNKAKQAAKKGVVLRQVSFNDDLAEAIWEIYNETPVRQGRRFPHFGKSLARVRAESATYLENSVFIGAFLEDKMIGFVKVLFDSLGKQAGLLNIVSLIAHRDKAPTNALVAEAVRVCADRSVSYLTYSNFSYGKKEQDSLSDFKERNAFERIEVPRYFIPLTVLGHAALKLGLHHDIKDRLPQSVSEKLRQIRQVWYGRRYKSLTEVS